MSYNKCYKQDYQDNQYQCGPSSLKMALSCYGLDVSEKWLAVQAGTTTSGTGHPGLKAAVNAVNKKHGKTLKIDEKYFSDLGWSGVDKLLVAGVPVMVHYKCAALPNWRYKGGHYSVIRGVTENMMQLICPTKGIVSYYKKTFEKAMAMVSRQGSILILKKK